MKIIPTTEVQSFSPMGPAYISPVSPYKKVSSQEVDFSVACTVIDTWELVRRIPKWERVTGEIFLRRLFEISPHLKELWGFGNCHEALDPAVYKEEAFLRKGAALIIAVDKAVAMLGPDLEPLETELFVLGRRHIYMKAEPEFWPLVGDALMYTLRQGLGEAKFTDYVEDSWNMIYDFLSYWMIEGLLAEKKDRWEAELVEKPKALRQNYEEEKEAVSILQISQLSDSETSFTSGDSVEYGNSESENPYEATLSDAITYKTVQVVLDSWTAFTAIKDWKELSAALVLRKLFELVPEIKTAWGFSSDFDPDNLTDPSHNRFVLKGLGFMAGVDKALAFLGPDLEPLETELVELGRIHFLFMAAKPEFWPPVGIALMHVFDIMLGDRFTDDVKESWGTLYNFMAYWMIEGLLKEKADRSCEC